MILPPLKNVAGEKQGFFCKGLELDPGLAENFEGIARAIVESLPTLQTTISFNVSVQAGSKLLAIGYIYPRRDYGLIIFYRHNGQNIKVSIDNGVYKRI